MHIYLNGVPAHYVAATIPSVAGLELHAFSSHLMCTDLQHFPVTSLSAEKGHNANNCHAFSMSTALALAIIFEKKHWIYLNITIRFWIKFHTGLFSVAFKILKYMHLHSACTRMYLFRPEVFGEHIFSNSWYEHWVLCSCAQIHANSGRTTAYHWSGPYLAVITFQLFWCTCVDAGVPLLYWMRTSEKVDSDKQCLSFVVFGPYPGFMTQN